MAFAIRQPDFLGELEERAVLLVVLREVHHPVGDLPEGVVAQNAHAGPELRLAQLNREMLRVELHELQLELVDGRGHLLEPELPEGVALDGHLEGGVRPRNRNLLLGGPCFPAGLLLLARALGPEGRDRMDSDRGERAGSSQPEKVTAAHPRGGGLAHRCGARRSVHPYLLFCRTCPFPMLSSRSAPDQVQGAFLPSRTRSGAVRPSRRLDRLIQGRPEDYHCPHA